MVDPRHSVGEERLVTFGLSSRGRLLAVMHAECAERVRWRVESPIDTSIIRSGVTYGVAHTGDYRRRRPPALTGVPDADDHESVQTAREGSRRPMQK